MDQSECFACGLEGADEGGFGGYVAGEDLEVGVRDSEFGGVQVEDCDAGGGGEEGTDNGVAYVSGAAGYEDVGVGEVEGEV